MSAVRYGCVMPIDLNSRFEAFWIEQAKCASAGPCADAVRVFCPAHWDQAKALLEEMAGVDIVRARQIAGAVPLQLQLEASVGAIQRPLALGVTGSTNQ